MPKYASPRKAIAPPRIWAGSAHIRFVTKEYVLFPFHIFPKANFKTLFKFAKLDSFSQQLFDHLCFLFCFLKIVIEITFKGIQLSQRIPSIK